MHRLCQWILGIFVFMAFAAAAEAAPYQESTEEQAQLELFCAWTDMAAYDDRLGNLARWQKAAGISIIIMKARLQPMHVSSSCIASCQSRVNISIFSRFPGRKRSRISAWI